MKPPSEERIALTHVDEQDRPKMVDVGDKQVTRRTAHASSRVRFPAELAARLRAEPALTTKKGPVVHTAIIAGVMAAKRTHELIPFCHALPLEDCRIEIDWEDPGDLVIHCRVRATYRTGVEMEALTGASVAALTVYDMCKALSHDIRIVATELVAKSGGRRDFRRDEGG